MPRHSKRKQRSEWKSCMYGCVPVVQTLSCYGFKISSRKWMWMINKVCLKDRSYYTAVELRYWNMIISLSQVTEASPHFKSNFHATPQCSNIAWVCSAVTQCNCGVVWMDLYLINTVRADTIIKFAPSILEYPWCVIIQLLLLQERHITTKDVWEIFC